MPRQSLGSRLDQADIEMSALRLDISDPVAAGARHLSLRPVNVAVEPSGNFSHLPQPYLVWGPPPLEGHPTPATFQLLNKFRRLGKESDDAIRQFAEVWGSLDLCEHGKPQFHQGGNRVCSPVGQWWNLDGAQWFTQVQPIEWWRRYALHVRGILSVAADVFAPEPRPGQEEDWAAILAAPGDPVEQWAPPELHLAHIEHQRDALTWCLENWLRYGGVSFKVFRTSMHPRPWLHLTSYNLPGAIALQLTSALTSPRWIYRCDACGDPYLEPERRPARNKRHYCPGCRESGDAGRHSKRAWWNENRRMTAS